MRPVSYIMRNRFQLIIVLILATHILAPLPFIPSVYYALAMLLSVLAVIKVQRVSIAAIVFLLVCALSIICGNAAPLFRSWERLGLFALLLISFFPVFQSRYFDELRSKMFPMMLFVLIFTCLGSFVGYFFGINYMGINRDTENTVETVGWFGGLTNHSMMLSPICAIALTTLVWALVELAKTTRTKIIICCAAFAALCCMMLTASRGGNLAGIAGVVSVLALKYRNRLGKMLRTGILLALLAVVLSPVYMPYADKVLEKQRRNEAAGSTLASRESRWEHRLQEFSEYPVFGYGFGAVDTRCYGEYMPSTGIVEPGSSWLAILSMTGLAGMGCFLALLYPTVSNLYYRHNRQADRYALLHLGIMTVFFVHLLVEGYIFAAGGALCFLFWFFFGCAAAYAKNPVLYLNFNRDYAKQ